MDMKNQKMEHGVVGDPGHPVLLTVKSASKNVQEDVINQGTHTYNFFSEKPVKISKGCFLTNEQKLIVFFFK